MSRIYINIIDGVVQEVLTNDPTDEVYLVNFDLDDSQRLSEAYVDVLNNPIMISQEIKKLWNQFIDSPLV